ncbi:MAG: hypothetical protein LBQ66_12915 [Planctomycetaceae bacterium]|nr:hypothetical protein [Planctomycetaceae bacterium]
MWYNKDNAPIIIKTNLYNLYNLLTNNNRIVLYCLISGYGTSIIKRQRIDQQLRVLIAGVEFCSVAVRLYRPCGTYGINNLNSKKFYLSPNRNS